MANLNNQSQTSKQGFDIPAIAKEVERVYGIYNQNIVRTVLEQAAAPELLEALNHCKGVLENDVMMKMAYDAGNKNALYYTIEAITKATGGTK